MDLIDQIYNPFLQNSPINYNQPHNFVRNDRQQHRQPEHAENQQHHQPELGHSGHRLKPCGRAHRH